MANPPPQADWRMKNPIMDPRWKGGGYAYFTGTGPAGTSCLHCKHNVTVPKQTGCYCQKATQLAGGKRRDRIDPAAPACKYWEA